MRKKEDIDNSQEDNVIYVDAPEEAAENNARIQREAKRRKNLVKLAMLIFILIIAGGLYIFVNKEYRGYRVSVSNMIDYENSANYVKFCDNLLKYTPDGVSYINSNGAAVWSAGINMSSPIVEVSGNYAVIADLGGNTVSVFNHEGQVTTVTMPYIICDVDIASQGAFAVVLESDETNYINMYNKKGEIIYEMQTTINKSGYPLDITISDDAKKLFTSYLNIKDNSVKNNLAAYNFGEVGQNSNADRLVGGYNIEDEIVSKVEFLENNIVVAFGTQSITLYDMKEKPSVKQNIKLGKEILSIFYCEDYFGYIEPIGDAEDTQEYNVKAYNKKGREIYTKKINFKYDNLYATSDELIISGENHCCIIRKNGTFKYNGILSGNIKSVVSSGKNNEYIVVYDNKTEKIKLKTGYTNNNIASPEEETNFDDANVEDNKTNDIQGTKNIDSTEPENSNASKTSTTEENTNNTTTSNESEETNNSENNTDEEKTNEDVADNETTSDNTDDLTEANDASGE